MKKQQKSDKVENVGEHVEIDNSDESADLELKERIESLENQLKRAIADYQNLEKRAAEERREWIKAGNKELLLRILPVLDTLILASGHTEDKSIQVSVAQFLDILKGEGVEKIDTLEKEFNPEIMEAVATVNGEDGKVVNEIRLGYKLYDKVLRPAQVTVGKSVS